MQGGQERGGAGRRRTAWQSGRPQGDASQPVRRLRTAPCGGAVMHRNRPDGRAAVHNEAVNSKLLKWQIDTVLVKTSKMAIFTLFGLKEQNYYPARPKPHFFDLDAFTGLVWPLLLV